MKDKLGKDIHAGDLLAKANRSGSSSYMQIYKVIIVTDDFVTVSREQQGTYYTIDKSTNKWTSHKTKPFVRVRNLDKWDLQQSVKVS